MAPQLEMIEQRVKVTSRKYTWEWDGETDLFTLRDARGMLVSTAPLQPLILIAQDGRNNSPFATDRSVSVEPGLVKVTYQGLNGTATLSVIWNFQDDFITLEPLQYETRQVQDIVSIVYFAARAADESYKPGLYSRYVVAPGLCMSPSVSPVIDLHAGLTVTTVLGSGAMRGPGLAQQWGLPAHYFCTFNTSDQWNTIGAKNLQSDAVCWGLKELPPGDYRLEFRGNGCSPVLNLRGDVWKHLKTPGTLQLGFAFILTFGAQFHEAIRSYYTTLSGEKIIKTRNAGPSARKKKVLLSPQYNTWGVECALGLRPDQFNEEILKDILRKFRESGLKASTFVIDDKWEGQYGQLMHDPVRFPHFEDQLRQLREAGYFIGLWAAFLRCENPTRLGLNESHLLQTPAGQPLWLSHQTTRYGIFDCSQPQVEKVLRERAREFIRRYNPDLIKFDFGYELPSLDVAAPADMTWAGEKLLQRGLEVVVGAMKAEKPDLVIMYYGLSPLLLNYYDLHSPDDLVYCSGDYDLETNRRIFFSSLCGELGMPTYGSSGYDWASAPDIWFDSVPSGTLGSLHCFDGDENGDLPRREWIARFNGLGAILRHETIFSIRPLDAFWQGGLRAAFSPSWERCENGKIVLLALRTHRFDGKPTRQPVGDVLEMNIDLVIASMTDAAISASPRLGIVPCGNGHCSLKRTPSSPGGKTARVVEHYWGGQSHQYLLDYFNGIVQLDFKLDRNGEILEWVEILFPPDEIIL